MTIEYHSNIHPQLVLMEMPYEAACGLKATLDGAIWELEKMMNERKKLTEKKYNPKTSTY